MNSAVFLNWLGNNLILVAATLAGVGWGAAQARATVILSERDLAGQPGIADEDLVGWLGIDPAQVARQILLGGMSGAPVAATEEDTQRERDARDLFCSLRGVHMSPAGMSATPSSSLAQPNGSGGGFAAIGSTTMPTAAVIAVSLPRDARMILPTRPAWRWFRPPRGDPALPPSPSWNREYFCA